jgi:hypothetical protein
MGLAAALAVVAVAVLAAASGAAPGGNGTRFAPSIDAPWANYGPGHGRNSDKNAFGLCRSNPFTLATAYPTPTAGEVDAIVNDPINDTGASNRGCRTPQNETTIAVNPMNPRNLIAGANDYRVVAPRTGLNDGSGWAYWSTDGGQTWGNVQLPGLTLQTGGQGVFKKMDSAGDPVIAFGPDGTAYYANIVFNRSTPSSGIAVSVSSDGGKTWSEPNMVSYTDAGNFFHDKEWIGAGPDGKVVVTWTRFNQGPQGLGYIDSPIVGAISNDRGKTWNRAGFPVSDATRPFNQGSQVSFGPDGALYVAYEATEPSTGYTTDSLVLARSTDDGRTFEQRTIARVWDDFDCYPVSNGRQTLTDMHFRLNSYPSMSIDRVTGRIALAWADQEGSGTCGKGGATFTGTTTANGTKLVTGTWASGFTAPVVVAGGGTVDTVFPAVAAHDGRIVVSYYTREFSAEHDPAVCNVKIPDVDPGGVAASEITTRSVCLDYAARSGTSAATLGAVQRLTSHGSNPFIQFANGAFIGDYTQVAFGSDGVAHAAWTDFRGRPGVTAPNQDVYVARIR